MNTQRTVVGRMLPPQQDPSLDYNLIVHSYIFKKGEKEKGHGHRKTITSKRHKCQSVLHGVPLIHIGACHCRRSLVAPIQGSVYPSLIVLRILVMPHTWENNYQDCRMRQRPGFQEVLNYFSPCYVVYTVANQLVHILLYQVQES